MNRTTLLIAGKLLISCNEEPGSRTRVEGKDVTQNESITSPKPLSYLVALNAMRELSLCNLALGAGASGEDLYHAPTGLEHRRSFSLVLD